MRIALIDNYDSFTYNLVHLVQKIMPIKVDVYRNDQLPLEEIRNYDKIILSPGPGIPSEAGLLLPLIKEYAASKSILGVCLGHQAIVLEAGGRVIQATMPVHRKASQVRHDGSGPFAGIDGPIHVGRYHSLCTPEPPRRFRVHAEIDGMAMAISDSRAMQTGLQFHPESILTPAGNKLLANILRGAGQARAQAA